jgi:hypothetical protein
MRPKHAVLITSITSLAFAIPFLFVLIVWAPPYGIATAAAFLAPIAIVAVAKRMTTLTAFAALGAFVVQSLIFRVWDTLPRLGSLEWYEAGAIAAILAGMGASIIAMVKPDEDAAQQPAMDLPSARARS